jgi:hypothetical protein
VGGFLAIARQPNQLPTITPAAPAAAAMPNVCRVVESTRRLPIFARPIPSTTSTAAGRRERHEARFVHRQQREGNDGHQRSEDVGHEHPRRTGDRARFGGRVAGVVGEVQRARQLRVALAERIELVDRFDGNTVRHEHLAHRVVGDEIRAYGIRVLARLVACGLGVEIRTRHHRDCGGDRSRQSRDEDRARVIGARGDTEDESEDRHGAVLHAEHDVAEGGFERNGDATCQ